MKTLTTVMMIVNDLAMLSADMYSRPEITIRVDYTHVLHLLDNDMRKNISQVHISI